MKKIAKIFTFLILIFCGVVFASCGQSGVTPSLSATANNFELVIGTDESKTFDVNLSNYGNGSDSVRVESYEQNKIIDISTQKIGEGVTRVTVKPLYPGKATIKISSITHNAKPIEVAVNVILPVGDIQINKNLENKIYVIKGNNVDFDSINLIDYIAVTTNIENLEGVKTNQVGVNYSLENVLTTDGVSIENGKLVVASDCALNEVEVKATSIYNSEISKTFKVKILNPITTSVYVDDNKIFENGSLTNGESGSYAFELYPRESDVTLSQKDVLLYIRAGGEADAVKIEKIFDESKYAVELKNLVFENGIFKYTYTISALNAGYLEGISFKISYKDYSLGEQGQDYFVNSGNLSVASYNLPNSVLVNGNSSTESGLDVLVFENIATISKGTLLEFTLSPANLAPEYGTIRMWANEYINCPVSFYKLNSTRTSFELVFGYPRDAKDGDKFVCSGIDHNGNAYFDMEEGTKLYVVKNQKFNKTTNTNAIIYASSLNFYDINSERSKIQLNIKVNPGASSVDRVNYDGTDFTIVNSNLIVSELIENYDIYLAIAPENFDLGNSSIIKLKNSNLADVSKLTVVASDDNYLYVKFTLSPKNLGSTKLTVYLCDGFEKEFDLKIISTLDNINIEVSQETESIVDYKENLVGKINDDDEELTTVQKLAFKSGTSIQLTKTAYPISAEYVVEYSFYDLENINSISELSIKDIFKNATFTATSNILNADILKNYSIIQAKTSQSSGKTLIKIDVKGRNASGEGYEEEASHVFYFLIEIYKGVDGFEISSNIHEVYSYETLGDKNAIKSKCEFSVTLQSRFGMPTYLNSLELLYGTEVVEFNDVGRATIKFEGEDIVVITRKLDGNVWTYTVQALTSDVKNLVFVLKLVEVDESKVIGGVVRVVVKDAVEIEDIEIVNVDLNDGIYIENNHLEGEENNATFEIKYNIYTKDGSEPLNTGLEFELSSNLITLGVTVDANGKITVPAGVGGNGKILIYPSSNYFVSSNGMQEGSNPFVEIDIFIANGESEETAIRIDSQDKISYLKKDPTKHYLLVGDFSISETIPEFSGGIYGLHNGKNATLSLYGTMFEKFYGIIKNVNIIGKIDAKTENLGAISYINYGNIENVSVSDFSIKNSQSDSFTGVLTGKNFGTISGGEIVASVNGANVGGVAGLNGVVTENAGEENEKTYNGVIEKITFAGNLTAGKNAGGIVAENAGQIKNCKIEKWSNNATAFIQAKNDATGYFGAVAGISNGTISQTYASSYNDKVYDITANTNIVVGGLVGYVFGGTITECMTNFSLEGENVGALVGKIENDGNVSHCYTLSKVSNSNAYAFAISGIDKISNSYTKAYYLDDTTTNYLTQTGGNNILCAGNYLTDGKFNADNFKLALQNNLQFRFETIWGFNSQINNGCIYLLNANPPQVIDSINIQISETDKTKYLYSQENGQINIVLYYYQLLEDLSDGVAISQLKLLNAHSLDAIFGKNHNLLFNLTTSSSISFVGNQLVISGVGKTEVKVTSKYASSTCKEQKIVFYVIYPIQEFNLYHGTSSLNPSTNIKNGDVDQVGYSKTELYSSNVKSTVLLNGNNYSIFTNIFAIGFKINANNSANNILSGINSLYENNTEGSATFDDEYKFVAEGTYTISPKEYVFAENESEKFQLDAILTLQNKGIGNYLGNITSISDFDTINQLISKNFKKNYSIQVVRGASRIQTTLTDSELSPSNVLNFDVVAISDKNEEQIIVEIYENEKLVGAGASNNAQTVENAIFDITVATATKIENNHNFNVYISVKSDVRKTISSIREFTIKIYDEDKKVVSSVALTLIPQEVVSISQSHYSAESTTENGFSIGINPTSVLKPGKNGLLALNLYPNYAAYSKIEIESTIVNGDYYVLFEQMINVGDNNYKNASGTIGYASERNTNKLTIYYSDQLAQDEGMVYVRTKIVESVSEGIYFPITIKVYPADTTKEVKTTTVVLASETINKAQITVDGQKDAVISRGNLINFEVSVNQDEELRDIRILNYEKSSTDGDYISVIYNTTEYEISNGKKVYKGQIKAGLNAEIAGDGKIEVQTIMRKMINGKLEEEYDSIILSIVDFTIEGMYIEGNNEDDNVFVAPIQLRQDLNFCFKLSETPAYNSSSVAERNAVNRIKENKKYFLENISLKIDYESNYNETNYNYSYNINSNKVAFSTNKIEQDDEKGYTYEISNFEENANLAYNLYYKNSDSAYFDENGNKNANNYFDVVIDRDENNKPLSATTFAINGLRSGNVPMQIKIAYTLPNDHNLIKYFTYDFVIKVQIYEDEDTPIAIQDEEEFLRYMNAGTTESGEPANYILMNDLYLTDFTPIANTIMIESLDGNNKIITIRNFNISGMLNNNQNQTLNLALFQIVNENTTLKNLTINLYELEDIIIDEEKVSNVNVAGLFIENSGIIYNCEITALNLAKVYDEEILTKENISVENLDKGYRYVSHSDGYGIRVYFDAENHGKLKKDSTTVQIAGLGIRNLVAGRITNSRVGNTSFKKVFMTDITNNKSLNYEFVAEHLTILGQADIAGVIIRNEGVIASSFFSNGYITNLAVSGTASKTAGFAIYNDYGGIIAGSYVKSFKKASELHSKFYTDGGIYAEGISAGFVYENNSSITDCYANLLLGGSLSGRLVSGFVYSNSSTGIVERCYSAATITGKLTTRMPFSGNNAKGDSMQLGEFTNCYYYVQNYDTETLLEEKYSTGAYGIILSAVDSDLLYGFAYTSDSKTLNGSTFDGVWTYNGEIELTSANEIAISVRFLIENYNGVEGARRLPYVNDYKYGSKNNPIIIRTADEFNRVFGQETGLKENAYYAISQYYNKNDGTVFGNYRLISHIDFNNLENIAATKVASSLMTLTGKDNIGGLFDGNGLTISNIEIALSEHINVGLFSQIISGAVFKNVNLTVKQVNAGNGSTVGGVAGLVYSSSLINIDLQATNLKGENRSEINGINVIGGIVGLVYGDSKMSNLSASISVISNYRGQDEYKRGQIGFTNIGYAGGIAGIIDIYKSAGESSVSESTAQVNKLSVSGESIIVEAYHVGGVVGYIGESTKASDMRFEISGSSNFEQKINSTGTTAGGIVGINKGNLSEIRIEHEDEVQKMIENSIAGYNKNGSTRYGHLSLFGDVVTTNDVNVEYVGGLVGQMISGNLVNSYAKVDVSLSSAKYTGGLIGVNSSFGMIDQVYALGDVDGQVAGGLIGKNSGTTTITHAVAINFYSKQNSNLQEALDVVTRLNGLDLSNATPSINGNNLILNINLEPKTAEYLFETTKIDNAFVIQEATALLNGNTRVLIYKVNNEFFLKVGNDFVNWTTNTENSEYEKYFELNNIKELFVKNGKIYKTYNPANKTKLSNEITSFTAKYYLKSLTVKENNKTIFTASSSQINSNGKIISLGIANVGNLVGENNEEKSLSIGNEVYANKNFTFNNIKFILNDNELNNVNELIKNLDNYAGVQADGTLLNRMFLAAQDAWDANMWAKDSDKMLPYLVFGVVSKVLYIEKPKDFLRLWKYSGEGFIVIIGDDPSTAFNPYEYILDQNKLGEFTQEDVVGLSGEGNNLYFDLSAIQDTFVPANFSGTIYGENSGKKYFVNGLTEKSLFKNISGAVVRNIAFGYKETSSKVHSAPLMAEQISNGALVTDILIQNATLNIKTSGGNVGALVNTVIDIDTLSNFEFNNVKFTLTNENINQNATINAGMFAGNINNINVIKNIKFIDSNINVDGLTCNQIKVGFVSGEINGSSCVINDVAVEESLIKIEADTKTDGYFGGYFGQSNITLKISPNAEHDIINKVTIDFTTVKTGKIYAGLLIGQSNNVTTESSIKIIGEIKNGNNYIYGYIGGFIGKAEGTTVLKKVELLASNKNLINVKVKSCSDFISAVGGLIGYGICGAEQVNIFGDILVANDCENSEVIAVGGLIGFVSNEMSIEGINWTVGSNNDSENNKITVVSGTNNNNYTGGLVGYANMVNVNIKGTINIWSIINVSGKNINAGGLVGYVDNNDSNGNLFILEYSSNNITFNGDINVTIEEAEEINLGGIIGKINGLNSSKKENISKINNVAFKNGAIYIKPNATDETTSIKTLNVGGLVGYMSHTLLSSGLVSGHIQIDIKAITTANIGGVVGQICGGTRGVDVGVIANKSWGNIKIADNMEIAGRIAGIVGYAPAGTYWRFGGNYTLTSIYNKNINAGLTVRALVGSAPPVKNSTSITDLKGSSSNNYYSHMYNLAIDDDSYGINGISNISEKFGSGSEGSKLNPILLTKSNVLEKFGEANKTDVKDMKYYSAAKGASINNETIYQNAHLIGNGLTITSQTAENSIIKTNDGYISGFIFETDSRFELKEQKYLDNNAPSGIADVNNGVIFANSVVVYGNKGELDESAQKYSIYAGVVGVNNGLISDVGAVIYVKNAIAGFVANNKGIIINSYVNGVVHNGAMYSFNGGQETDGKIQNCYTSIRQGGVIDSATGGKPIFNGGLSNVYYDRNGTEISQGGTTEKTTEKTTNEMSVYEKEGENNEDFLANLNKNSQITIFASDFQYNFGYPTLSAGAYKNSEYLKTFYDSGAGSENALQIPNLGKLEQFQLNSNIKYVALMTDLDYANADIGHTQIETICSFEGNNYSINNILGDAKGGFFETLEKDKTIDYKASSNEFYYIKDHEVQTGTNYSYTYERENYGVSFSVFYGPTRVAHTYLILYGTNIIVLDEKENLKSSYSYEFSYAGEHYSINYNNRNYYLSVSQCGEIKNVEFNYKSGAIVEGNTTTSVGAVINTFNGKLINVRSSGATVYGSKNVGGLVGEMSGGSIDNCYNFNDVKVTTPANSDIISIGGIVGYAERVNFGDGTSNKTTGNYGNISAGGQVDSNYKMNIYVGGIIGYAYLSRVNEMFNIGNVNNHLWSSYEKVKAFAGGIIGYYNNGYSGGDYEMVSYLYNYGNVNCSNHAGGIIGYAYTHDGNDTDYKYLFNYGDVIGSGGGDAFVGGIIGAYRRDDSVGGKITNSGNEGSVTGTGGNWAGVGGIVGAYVTDISTITGGSDTNGGAIDACYNSGALYVSSTKYWSNDKDFKLGFVGGIAGGNVKSITNCSMTGTISVGDAEVFGWIMGTAHDNNSPTISECYVEPSTVTVQNKGNDPGQDNHTDHDSYTGSARFYLDYQYGISVYSKMFSGSDAFRNGKKADERYGEYKPNNAASQYNFDLSYKLLGNNYNVNADVSNLIKIPSVKVTNIVLNYYSNNKSGAISYHFYVHCYKNSGFLTLSSGIYKIGQATVWHFNSLSGLPSTAYGGLTSTSGETNLKNDLNSDAHKFEWNSKSVTSPSDNGGTVEVTSATDLAYISKNVESYCDKNIKLMNDIDLTGYIWTPIGITDITVADIEMKKEEDWDGGIGFPAKEINVNGLGVIACISLWSDDYYNNVGKQARYYIYLDGEWIFSGAETTFLKEGRYIVLEGIKAIFERNGYRFTCSMKGFDWEMKVEKIDGLVNFSGSFDGNGYTISGMAAYSKTFGGLFANIHNNTSTAISEFKNVKIEKSVVQAGLWAGTIAGQVAGGGNYVLIYNNIIDAKVYSKNYSTDKPNAASIVGRLGNTGDGYKALIVGNIVNSNQSGYASSDGGYVAPGNEQPKIIFEFNNEVWFLFFGWQATNSEDTHSISGDAIYGNVNDQASFLKFNNLIYTYNSGNGEAKHFNLSTWTRTIQLLAWRFQRTSYSFETTTIDTTTGNSVISDFDNEFSYSYNGSNSSTDITRFDLNDKYFNANYSFELEVYDSDEKILSFKYGEQSSHSFMNDILPFASHGDTIIGYVIKGTTVGKNLQFNKNDENGEIEDFVITYDDLKDYVDGNNIVKIDIVRAQKSIAFNVGNNAGVTYLYEYDTESGSVTFANGEEDLYTPTGRTGYWVDENGAKFELKDIDQSSGSFILYWIDAPEAEYDHSTYFYKITLKLNNGTADKEVYVLKDISSYALSQDISPTPPDGQTFIGWSDGTHIYRVGETIEVTDNITLTAQYVDKTYTINFVKGAESASGEMISIRTQLQKYTLPDCGFIAPPGQTFDGWYYNNGDADIELSGEIDFTKLVLTNDTLTLTAKWKDLSRNVTIYIDAGDVEPTITQNSVTYNGVDYNIGVIQNPNSYWLYISYNYALNADTTAEGYNKSSGEIVDVAVLSEVLNLSVENITLSNFKQFTIFGNAKFGVIDSTLKLGIGSKLSESIIPANLIGDITLAYYGEFNTTNLAEANYFRTISYKFGDNLVYSEKYTKGYEIQENDIPETLIYKAGYKWIGFGEQGTTTRADIARSLNGTEENDLTYTNQEVQVKFGTINYNVNYDANGGTGTEIAGGTFNIETPYTIVGNTYKKTGYKFVGWNTRPDGTGSGFDKDDLIEYGDVAPKFNSNVTLYAQWVEIVITLEFKPGTSGNGAGPQNITLKYGDAVTLPSNTFGCPWYLEFDGWKCDKIVVTDDAGKIIFDNTLTDDVTYTFTAQWKQKTLTIIYDANSPSSSITSKHYYPQYGTGTYTLPEAQFDGSIMTRKGYDFAGWKYNWTYKDEGGNYQIVERTAQPGTELTLDNLFAKVVDGEIVYENEITITATWTPKYSYSIVIKANSDKYVGLELNSYNDKTFIYATDVLETGTTLIDPGFVVTAGDYNLIGFAISDSATEATYTVGGTINLDMFLNEDGTPKADYFDEATQTITITLYSVWESVN